MLYELIHAGKLLAIILLDPSSSLLGIPTKYISDFLITLYFPSLLTELLLFHITCFLNSASFRLSAYLRACFPSLHVHFYQKLVCCLVFEVLVQCFSDSD